MMNTFTTIFIALSLCLGVNSLLDYSASGRNENSGKGHVVFIGDSNTWNGGDDCSNPKAWSYWMVKNMLPATARSYARSGATWTNNAATVADTASYFEVLNDQNVLYNQILRLKGEVKAGRQPVPDYIFLSGGTNDAWFSAKRPGLYNSTVEQAYSRPMTTATTPAQATSLAEAVRLNLMLLKDAFPNARIIVVGPPYTTKASKETIEKVADIIQQSARKSGVECIRIEKNCGIDPVKEKQKPQLTSDGTHTNNKGAWQIARCVYDYLAFSNPQ